MSPSGIGAPAPAAAPASLADRQLQVLAELAELGLKIAAALERRVSEADPAQPLAELQGAGMAYARVARAVRQTVMLRAKLARELDHQARDFACRAELAEARTRQAEEDRRKARVERLVERLATARCGEDEDGLDRIMTEACERLDLEDYGKMLARPVSEILADICRDLGLEPDWANLVQEAWAREEIAGGAPGWPFVDAAAPPPPPAGEGGREAAPEAFHPDTG